MEQQKRWEGLLRGQIISATTAKFVGVVRLADQKAQALIFLNSILIPVSLNWIDIPQFHVAASISIVTALSSILAAIIAIYPKRKPGRKDKDTFNFLHFNDIGHIEQQDFLDEFMPLFNDPSTLAEVAIKDLHDVARNSIIPKFFWLKLAYAIFFIGNVFAIFGILFNFWGITSA